MTDTPPDTLASPAQMRYHGDRIQKGVRYPMALLAGRQCIDGFAVLMYELGTPGASGVLVVDLPVDTTPEEYQAWRECETWTVGGE